MKTGTTPALDEKKKAAFAEKMMQHLNGAGISLMTSIAHRTGLFDAMAGMDPAGSREIADRAGLNERYVREALGAFVTGGIVEYDPDSATYRLPPEHAAWLTRAARPDNMAVPAQFVAVLASVEDEIVRCFHEGGGVPYEKYHRFHEVMTDESEQTVVDALLDHIIPLVPGLREKLQAGIEVLDVGCGSGYALGHLAKHFPASRFTGYDLCPEAIERARRAAAENHLKNVSFQVQDVKALEEQDRYGLITTFDAIHDQAAPARVLAGIRHALAPDGTYLMQDIAGTSDVHEDAAHPLAPFLYTISCMHCMSVSLAHNGAGLGAMWGRKRAEAMLREAGFREITVRQLEHDIMNDYYIVKK